MLNPEIVAIYEKYPQGANDPACVAEINRYLEEHLDPCSRKTSASSS